MLERLQKKSEIIRKKKLIVKKLESVVTSDINEILIANNVSDYQQVIIKEILAATKV